MSHIVDPPCLDVIARISRSSSLCRDRDRQSPPPPCYNSGATPPLDASKPPLLKEEPPLRIPLTDPRWAGLVVHSIAIGFVSSVLPLTVYPFLMAFLNVEGTQTLSARTLLALPWVFRPLFRIAIDCVPLRAGEHHRPYILLGWFIASLALGAIYFIEVPTPYFADYTLIGPQSTVGAEELNEDAATQGGIYVMLMTVATVGYVIADVAADALIQAIAERFFPSAAPGEESPFVPRVTLQRYGTMLVSFIFMGVGMSGPQYGGGFDFTLTYNDVMLITGIIASVPIPFVWLLVQGIPCERQSLTTSFQRVWDLMQNRAVASVIAFRFLGGVCGSISATPVDAIALYWVGMQPISDNIFNFAATAIVILFIIIADKRGWEINYRFTIIGANLLVLMLDCGATLFTIWNVIRSQWIWIGLPVLDALPSGLDYVILTVILGAIVEPETEELMRSLVAATSFLAMPFGHTLTKYIDALFDVSNEDLAEDTTRVRVHATAIFMIAYASKLLSLAWLFTLPRDFEQARAWKMRSEASPLAGSALVAVLALCLVWSIAVHVLSVMDATSCLWIAGGRGCDMD